MSHRAGGASAGGSSEPTSGNTIETSADLPTPGHGPRNGGSTALRWVRRVLAAGLVLGLLVTLLGAGWVVSVKVKHPRDEAAFIHNLDHSVRGNLCEGCAEIWKFPPVDDGFLIAEGDRACAWLADQPYPWWRRAERFTYDGLVRRYLATNPVSKAAWSEGTLRPDYRSFVVGEAWHELCGATLVLHEPRNPFNRPAETD